MVTQQEQKWNGPDRRNGVERRENVVTVNSCLLQSQEKANEIINLVRKEMNEFENSQQAKLDHIAEVVETMSKSVNQLVFKIETPQIGINDRMAAFEKFQRETTAVLQSIQSVLTGLADARKKTDKLMDWIVAGIVTYTLVRLLPYIGQLLQK